MEIQQEGFCPHLWWTWGTDGSLGLGALLCSLRNFPSSNSAQTSSTQCISSSKHPPAPPKDHACQTNLVSQLLFQTTCHTPSRLLYLHLSGSPLGGFLHPPGVAWSIAMQFTRAHAEAGANSQAKFRGGGKTWRTTYTPITTLHAGRAAKFPLVLWCKSTQLPGVVSM